MAPSDGEKDTPPPIVDKNNLWKIQNLTVEEQSTLNILKYKVVAVKRQITTKVNKSTGDLDRFEEKVNVTLSEYERIYFSTQEDDKKISVLTSDFHDLLFNELYKFFQDTLLGKYDSEEAYTVADSLLIKEEKTIVYKVQTFNKHLDKTITAILKRVPANIPQTNYQTAPTNDQGGSTNASTSHR